MPENAGDGDVDSAFGLSVEEPPRTPEQSKPRPKPATTVKPRAVPREADPPKPTQVVSDRENRLVKDRFVLGAGAGIVVLKGARIQPALTMDLGWNLGRVLGWPGLFIKLDTDLFIGSSPLGAEYIMLDALAGFDGRFGLGPVRLSVGLGFGLRYMSITKQSTSSSVEPEMGFGAGLRSGLEWPVWRFLSLALDAEGRYTKDPLTGQFVFSGVISGGLRFVF